MFEAWLFVLANRARLPDTVDFVLYDLFSIFAYICAQAQSAVCSLRSILVPRAHDPFGLRQGSRPLAGTR